MKIFITRDLKADDALRKMLQQKGYKVHAQSLIDFELVPFNYFPPCEWIFFYSPRCVDFFFETADPRRYRGSKFAVMGGGTARALLAHDIVPDFIGNGIPAHTAEALAEEAHDMRVLFPRAENSRRSVEKLLADDQIELIDIIVYSNTPKTDFTVPKCDVLVFTSPLNAEAYFMLYDLKKGQKVVAIGKTTAEYLRGLEIYDLTIAAAPTAEGIFAAVTEKG